MNILLTTSDPKASLPSVPDPTDWDNTKLPLLNLLDSALRCDICKDFYTSPVITNCSHTFCSGCIRRALNAEQICPICRTGEQEYRLRKNPVVQELVDAFLGARPKLLEVAREIGPTVQVLQANSPFGSQSEAEHSSSPPAKRQRPSSRAIRSTRSTPRYTEEQHGDDIIEIPAPSDGLVGCPSCQKRMKMEVMNSHLDNCLLDEYKPSAPSAPSSQSSASLRTNTTRSSKSSSSSSTPTAPLQPLPKISYSFLKEKDLRNKLAELGIPSGGPRKLLQERHSEWMTIWNANVDAKRPRTKKELLADLIAWEKAHLQPSNQPAKARWSDDQWKDTHEDQFNSLIKEARARAEAAKKKKAEDTAKEGAQKGLGEGVSEVQKLDENSTKEAQSATPPARVVAPISGPLMGEQNGNSVTMTTAGPNLDFGMVGPNINIQSRDGDLGHMNIDSQDFSNYSGKRKHSQIDDTPATGTV